MSIYQQAKARIIEKLETGMTYTRQLIRTYKKEAAMAAIGITVAISSAGMGHAYYQSQIDTIYYVYWHGDKVGVVNDPDVITNWIDHKLEEESNKFAHVHMQIEDYLNFKSEEGYKPIFDNKKALNTLQSEFALKASAVKVVIDGEFIGYAPDEESVEHLLDELKSNFVSEEFLTTMNSQPKKANTVRIASIDEPEALVQEDIYMATEEALQLNQPKMTEALIKEDIQMESSTVHPNQVLSSEQIRERLKQSKVEEKNYQVDSGDVLGTIAQKNGLKLDELLALNPELNEDTVLQIGQDLVVEGLEPYITVVTVEQLKREEVIEHAVETKSDANMYRGDTRVEREGKDGKKIVKYKIIKENGQEVNRDLIDQEIITEPLTKIVVRGDKIKPSRGTGQFAWPTVGGRITSGYGQRWGRLHAGMDIAGVRDRTIKAADHGKVTTAGWHRGYGNHVIINHDNGYQTLYGHLSSLDVKKGEVVKKGDKIGVMGSTGNSTGVHLHFEVIKNGSKINPNRYISR